MTGRLPPTASVATPLDGARLHAPSAERNAPALCDLLLAHAPAHGAALEIASGTGQHVAVFAAALPGLDWQPTDPDPIRRASIDAYAAGAANIRPAVALDATAPGWGVAHHPRDLIVLVNLLHLIPDARAAVLVTEAATALAPGGVVILYGPFTRGGRFTSDGDARFDAELRRADPAIGYTDDALLRDWLTDSGLNRIDTVEMPANNLAFVARREITT